MILKALRRWRQARRDKMIAELLVQRDTMQKALEIYENDIFMWIICHDHLVECRKLLAEFGYKGP